MNTRSMNLISVTNHVLTVALALTVAWTMLFTIGAEQAKAVVIYSETFDTDTPDTATTLATYPDWSNTGGTTATVSGGQLNLTGTASLFTIPGFAGEHFIEADYGATGVTIGSTQLRFRIGGVRTLFHPGYVGPPAGAFRFEENVTLGNQDMGFVPAVGVMHHISIHAHGDGNFDLTITDGNNPLNTYSNSFFDPASVGQPIGFGLNSVGTGFYDNLIVDDGFVPPVPEPSSIVLLGLGFFGLVRHTRRRRRKA